MPTHPRRLPSALLLVILGGLAAPAASEQDLFVADPAADAVLRVPLEDGDTPELLSGRIALLADRAAFLSPREVLFSLESDDRLVVHDLEAKTFTEVAEPPAGAALLALDAGPGPGVFTALYGFADGRMLVRAAGRDASGRWAVDDVPAPIRRDPRNAPLGAGILGLGNGRVVLCADGSPGHELIIFRLDDPADYGTLREDIDVRVTLVRHPVGGWIAWPGQGTRYQHTTLFNQYGKEEREIPLEQADDELGWARLRAEGSFAPPPAPPEYGVGFSFVAGDGEDGLHWRLFHPVYGGVYWLDSAGHALTREFVFEAGNGPGFEMIRDIATGADGALYVLDGLLEPLRLLRVDPDTGDRSVAALLPADRPYERLVAAPGGAFLLPRVQAQPAASGPGPRPFDLQVVDRLTVTEDPAAPVLESPWEFPRLRRLADLGVDAAGDPRVLLDPAEGLRVGVLRDGRWLPTPNLQFESAEPMSFIEETDTPDVAPFYRGAVIHPHDGAPARPERLRLSVLSSRGGVALKGLTSLLVTAPDGHTRFEVPVRDPFHESFVWEGAPFWRESTSFEVPPTLGISGAWTVEAIGLDDPGLTLKLALVSQPAPRARFLEPAADGTLWLYETHPAALARWNETDGSVERVPLLLEDGPLLPGDLDRATDLLVDSATGRAWVSLLEKPAVVEIDTATGSARARMSGRPGSLDNPLLDFGQASQLRLAIGNAIHSGAGGGWRFSGD